MRDQEFIGLQEAYNAVYENQEQLDEAMSSYDRNRRRAAQRAEARNEARRRGQTGNVPGVGYVSPRPERTTWTDESGQQRHHTGARMPKKEDQKESFDLFDYLLEYLVAEGYADTNKAALAIMANMSEEWKQSIVEAGMNPSETPAAKQQTTKSAVDFFTKSRKPLPPYEAKTPRFPALTVPDFGLGTSKPSVKIPKFGRDDGRTEKPRTEKPRDERPAVKPPVTKAKPPVTPAPPKAETPKTETPKPTEAPKVETPKQKGGEVAMSKIGDKSDYSVAATAKMSDRTKTILGTKDSETGKTIRKPQFGSLSPRERRGLG